MTVVEKLPTLFSRGSRFCCSIVGLKIAVPVAVFVMLPILGHIFLHEYLAEGSNQLYGLLTNPAVWGVALLAFCSLMVILSKVVILPLKKLEIHISEIERGVRKDPFVHKANDEIGFLANRFNSLHNTVLNKIESRDVHLSVLYDFTNSTAGIFDIPTLMDMFFKILRTAVEFDTGAYVISSNGVVAGRIYSAAGELGPREAEQVTAQLLSMAGNYCRDLEGIGTLDVCVIGGASSRAAEEPRHFINLPIVCNGEPVGIVSFISFSSEVDPILGSKVFNAMVRHASTVIEKLLSHISDEGKKLSQILSSMSEGVYLIDRHGNTACVNKKGLDLIAGYCSKGMECAKKEFEPVGCHDGNGCEFPKVLDRIKKLGPGLDGMVHSEEIRDRLGRIIQISASSLETGGFDEGGFVITAKDVTEDRMVQKRVMLSSKLAALGEMAAGIAHEVNNPLQAMLITVELLEDGVTPAGGKRLVQLRDSILRIKGIVRDLLIFAREQTTELESVDINNAVCKMADILKHQLRMANVKLEFDLSGGQALVRCNGNLFQQVMINLLQNAKDAIEETGKGSAVRITTKIEEKGDIVMEVRDDGPGIPESVIDRIFDPFFTTKDVGKGTGLGLSVSRRIIEGMGGSITVVSSLSAGTLFTVRLPGLNIPASGAGSAAPAPQDFNVLADKSVIIIDDEETVLKGLQEILGRAVGSVDAYSDGQEALDSIMDNEYDFVLMDIRMPGMNGMELYRRIKAVKPYLAEKILFLTGDTENEATGAFIKLTGCACLSKPFTGDELLSVMCRYELEMAG